MVLAERKKNLEKLKFLKFVEMTMFDFIQNDIEGAFNANMYKDDLSYADTDDCQEFRDGDIYKLIYNEKTFTFNHKTNELYGHRIGRTRSGKFRDFESKATLDPNMPRSEVSLEIRRTMFPIVSPYGNLELFEQMWSDNE